MDAQKINENGMSTQVDKKYYTYEEAFKASVEYFNGDELAANVFVSKYALNDGDGRYYELTPKDMHKRLAKEFARIEAKYPNPMSEKEIFNLLDGFKFCVPQGSPMAGIGNKFQIQSIGNCFVLEPPLDSYGGILKTDQELVQLMKRRAGVGISLDNIRPKGVATKNAAKTTDGIGVFMERFSNSCREVAMQGRRGAEMQMLSAHHPEIETFINIKRDKKKVTGANISIKLTDEFMNAVKNNAKYELRWPVDSTNPAIVKKINAKIIWDQIVDSVWNSAEPGLFFIDNQLKYTPADVYGKINKDWVSTATNPCGEIGMGVDSCRLLLINLYSFVKNPYTTESFFDFISFGDIVIKSQRLMDDIVDLELEFIEKILKKIEQDPEPEDVKAIEKNMWLRFRKNAEDGRRTGLGITALGDTVAALGIRYGSEKSIEMTENIYKSLAVNAYKSSCIMAAERGAFPIFCHELEKEHPFIQRILNESTEVSELYNKYGRRNIALTTTAPAGSVSILTQTTSGIEPVFMLKYDRYRKVNPSDPNVKIDRIDVVGDAWQKYTVYEHGFKRWMNVTGKTNVEDSPYYKATSADVDWVSGVKLQAAAQKWVCHSISRTANIPKESSKELVSAIYLAAWEAGCKGYTVYRDGCRDGVLVNSEENKKESDVVNKLVVAENGHAPKRPSILQSETHKMKIDFGNGVPRNTYITVSFYPDTKRPYELFIQAPYQGLDEKDLQILELTARSTSMSLRHGVPIKYICEQLDKIDGQYLFSIPVNVAKILRKYDSETAETFDAIINSDINEAENGLAKNHEKENGHSLIGLAKCPECKEKTYKLVEGCGSCMNCGYSGCG